MGYTGSDPTIIQFEIKKSYQLLSVNHQNMYNLWQNCIFCVKLQPTLLSQCNINSNYNNNNPHLNFLKVTVLGDKGQGIRNKGQVIRPKRSLTLRTKSCLLSFCKSLAESFYHLSKVSGKRNIISGSA